MFYFLHRLFAHTFKSHALDASSAWVERSETPRDPDRKPKILKLPTSLIIQKKFLIWILKGETAHNDLQLRSLQETIKQATNQVLWSNLTTIARNIMIDDALNFNIIPHLYYVMWALISHAKS